MPINFTVKCAREYARGQLRFRAWLTAFFSLMALLTALAVQADEQLEKLVINHQVYSNVIVQSKTATHLFFKHDRGVASAKLCDVPSISLKAFGYQVEDSAKSPSGGSKAAIAQIAPQVWEKTLAMSQPLQEKLAPMVMKMLWVFVGFLVLGHLVVSFCLMLICRKAGQEPGIAVWIPIIQMFPLLTAAKMSGWSFLLFLLPVLNLIAALVWCVKICQALHKPPFLGLLLFLPVTGIFVLFYLAFSNGGDPNEPQIIKLDYPEPVETE